MLRALFTLATLGWDFPLLRWWLKRPRVQARIQRRREALRVLVEVVKKLVTKFV